MMVSWALSPESKTHFMCPCVPRLSRMWPRRPNLVISSTGLNQSMSSGVWNMYRMVADFLLILYGCPEDVQWS